MRAKERALREREAGLQAGEAAAAKYCAKDSALEQREAALAEREAAMARATAAAEYARSEAETLWRSHKVCNRHTGAACTFGQRCSCTCLSNNQPSAIQPCPRCIAGLAHFG